MSIGKQRGKVERFASANPVFTRDRFREDLFDGQPRGSADSLLRYHVGTGRFLHVATGVYATVPAHLNPRSYQPDRYAVASLMRPDGVLAFGSALDLHGLAYSETDEMHVLSDGRPGRHDTKVGTVRFVSNPASLREADRQREGVETLDRRGLPVAVTGLERTIIDCLERPEYAGGLGEVAHALSVVDGLDVDAIVRMALDRVDGTLAGILGWWLSSRPTGSVSDKSAVDRLRALAPTTLRAAYGTAPDDSVTSDEWNVRVPRSLAEPRFEDVSLGAFA